MFINSYIFKFYIKMGIYQLLKEAGFKESQKGPVVISELTEIIEGIQSSRGCFAIVPRFLVPDLKLEYSGEVFNNLYIIFELRSKKIR